MLGRRTSAVSVFIALPTLVLASCHLVGGTTDLDIDPLFHEQGEGGDNTTGTGGDNGTTSSTTSSSSTGGTGGSPPMCDPTACPGMPTDCVDIICDAQNMCATDNVDTLTPCTDGGNYCDGAGQCVECITTEHCTGVDPNALCLDFACYQPGCNNTNFDPGTETDFNCGNECPPCADGLDCVNDTDCQSLFCDNTVCRPCDSSSDCPAEHYCDGPPFGDEECKPQLNNNEVCGSHAQCKSGCCDFVFIIPICQSAGNCG